MCFVLKNRSLKADFQKQRKLTKKIKIRKLFVTKIMKSPCPPNCVWAHDARLAGRANI